MLGELASPKDNKPSVVSSGDDVLSKAVAAVDKSRHNSGAVFAYVDGHVQWLSSSAIGPAIFVPSIPTNYLSTPMKLGSLFDNIVQCTGGTKYTQNVRTMLEAAGMANATGTSLGNSYIHFYDANGSISYGIAVNGAAATEISPLYNAYDPTTVKSPHAVPWWQIGPGGSTITGFNYQGFACGWGAKNLYPITGLSNATAISTTLIIKPTAGASGVKKMALVAYNGNAAATVVATMNYIRLGSDTTTTFTSGHTTTAATPSGGTDFVASAIGFVVPVQENQNIAIKYTAQASGAVTRGGAFLVFED
ncbi:MAG TPA: H-X9-DG-CTERM domain-containing protein [Armatimonadota bacterium]